MQGLTSLQMRLDRVRFARACGLDAPDPWQGLMLRSTHPRVIANCHRQSGKSTVAALVALHQALFTPSSLALLLSPTLRQSSELFRKCLDVYRALGRSEPAEAESALRLELENGSRIISLPGKEGTVRGISKVKLLIIDEASRVPDELYKAVRPMLAVSGGRLILLSTPFGTRGFYYEEYLRREKWDYYEVPAEECPRISKEFLEEEKETMGEWWFEQEYHCKFLSGQDAAFRIEDIDRIVKRNIETWEL